MALHQLSSVTIGVPNVAETAGYYADFGLTDLGDGTFATIDGGPQLRIVQAVSEQGRPAAPRPAVRACPGAPPTYRRPGRLPGDR